MIPENIEIYILYKSMSHCCFRTQASAASNDKDKGKLGPWASKPARHYFDGLDMQRNE